MSDATIPDDPTAYAAAHETPKNRGLARSPEAVAWVLAVLRVLAERGQAPNWDQLARDASSKFFESEIPVGPKALRTAAKRDAELWAQLEALCGG